MTSTDTPTAPGVLVPGAHRLIRAVESGDGPFTGALVSHGDDVAVCVDAADLAGWGGWRYSGCEHVCGVLDVRRRSDGHDMLLPWCTQRVEAFLGRRRTADVLLAPGEVTTLVASLLRGVGELGDDVAAQGDWWLTGDGRPLFVHGEDGGAARVRTAALIDRVIPHAADRATARILTEIGAALREPRHHRDDDARWEHELLSSAAPRPLRTDVFAPERAASVATRKTVRVPTEGVSRPRSRSTERRGVREGLLAAMTVMRERARSSLERFARTRAADRPTGPIGAERSVRHPHRRSLVLAATVAAVVLGVGLMWPEGHAEEAAQTVDAGRAVRADSAIVDGDPSEVAPSSTVPEPAPSDEPSESPEPSPGATEDAVSALPRLLEAIAGCVHDGSETCPDAIVAEMITPTDGLIIQGAQGSEVSLVDDYGDVTVMRLSPLDAEFAQPEQMVVLERPESEWLVRDVYDVAHQPG
ncbi:hypothetical protein HD600_002729 [Microbacterium ginsengiterrae]|uniref:Uncharacterized protein n=1 Tax=Microbacterium ginsengiterrae TaxID=546115 RepID=A0A7W9CEN3_9MICO|nr:hypothetical protein [Microbacterium ginsengiterrae]MBB5744232.1 hypothetical protein [Microbacterium ginsengiterrae]